MTRIGDMHILFVRDAYRRCGAVDGSSILPDRTLSDGAPDSCGGTGWRPAVRGSSPSPAATGHREGGLVGALVAALFFLRDRALGPCCRPPRVGACLVGTSRQA